MFFRDQWNYVREAARLCDTIKRDFSSLTISGWPLCEYIASKDTLRKKSRVDRGRYHVVAGARAHYSSWHVHYRQCTLPRARSRTHCNSRYYIHFVSLQRLHIINDINRLIIKAMHMCHNKCENRGYFYAALKKLLSFHVKADRSSARNFCKHSLFSLMFGSKRSMIWNEKNI